MRVLFSVFKWLFGAAAVLLLVVVAVNLRDEALDPEVTALLAQERFANPYSGRPMAFDAARKGQSFEPRTLGDGMQGSPRLVDRRLIVPLAVAN